MADKSSRNIKLGLFVISATILLAAIIIVLAGRRWGVKEYAAYTTLDESVQGLEVGAAVKFRGVPIGSIHRITIQDEDLKVRVDMELYEGSIQVKGMTIREFMRQQIKHGARCQVSITGITGFRYIDIGIIPEEQRNGIPQKTLAREGPLYIPSVRSVIAGVTADISYTLAEIAAIDFESIGANVDQLLGKFNAYLEDERVETTLEQVEKALTDINKLVGSMQNELEKAELGTLSAQARETLAKYDTLPEKVNSAADSIRRFSENAQQTLAESDVPQTATDARRTLTNIQAALNETSNTLNQALAALTRVAELLEQDTAALLRGKQAPPVEMGGE